MARPPFDPDRAAGGAEAARSRKRVNGERDAGAHQLTVSQATELIKVTLETRLPSSLRVVGEVSNLSEKNHWYFSLKDEAAVLSCVAWATAVKKFGFTPKDGDEVLATGHVSHYGPQGRTQMYVSELVPVGAGALELRFRALCEELRQLGYFDETRKKPLPIFPRRIAVITSASGAAIQDVINTAAQRCKAIGLTIIDVRVQGEGAAQQVAHAIIWVDRNHQRLGVDAILVTRGGGSIEDLWAFNERVVADAVFKCHLPVVAAIGHESDTTVVELVADVRASTPTQAAMRLIPSSQELCQHIEHLSHRLGSILARVVEHHRQRSSGLSVELRHAAAMRVSGEWTRLERLTSHLVQFQPRAQLTQRQARLAVINDRLNRTIMRRIDRRSDVLRLESLLPRTATRHIHRIRDRLLGIERQLAAMDPHGVLRRGYSLTTHRDGRLIRSATQVKSTEQIITRFSDGSIESTVGAMNIRSKGQPPSNSKNTMGSADQLDLFSSSR